jgi:hypothetical protein
MDPYIAKLLARAQRRATTTPAPDVPKGSLKRYTSNGRVFMLIEGHLDDEQRRLLHLNMAMLRATQDAGARMCADREQTIGSAS